MWNGGIEVGPYKQNSQCIEGEIKSQYRERKRKLEALSQTLIEKNEIKAVSPEKL